MSEVIVNEDMYSRHSEQTTTVTTESDQIQQALMSGSDIELQPTAAGSEGHGGGHSTFNIDHDVNKGHIDSGAETHGIVYDTTDTLNGVQTQEDTIHEETKLVTEPVTEPSLSDDDDDDDSHGQNNGFGNGDQSAPGNSGPHNNAENSDHENPIFR